MNIIWLFKEWSLTQWMHNTKINSHQVYWERKRIWRDRSMKSQFMVFHEEIILLNKTSLKIFNSPLQQWIWSLKSTLAINETSCFQGNVRMQTISCLNRATNTVCVWQWQMASKENKAMVCPFLPLVNLFCRLSHILPHFFPLSSIYGN